MFHRSPMILKKFFTKVHSQFNYHTLPVTPFNCHPGPPLLRCYLPLLVVLPATIQSQSSSSQGSSDPKQQKGQSKKKDKEVGWGEVMGQKM